MTNIRDRVREILQKVYNDGMLAGAKSTGERNYMDVCEPLHELAEIVRGEKKDREIEGFRNAAWENTRYKQGFNHAIDHIAKLFEEDKDGR